MVVKADVIKIYETLLSIPGMNENIKVTLNIPRKNVLLLSKIIERGLTVKDPEDKSNLMEIVTKEILQELLALPPELLEKAGLTAMNQKLQSL